MVDKLTPRTAIDRGPPGEEFIGLDQARPEVLPEAGGDTSANEIDSNVGGAAATAGLDSGGAVGVRRGLSVGRPGAEYEGAPAGETDTDVPQPDEEAVEEGLAPGERESWPASTSEEEQGEREAY
jgi:hypothetical protein